MLQGGVLSAMLDLSMAFLSLAVLPAESTCATAQLNVHFRSPAFPGVFYADAEMEKSGKRVLFNRAMLHPAAGSGPGASATAVFAVLGGQLTRVRLGGQLRLAGPLLVDHLGRRRHPANGLGRSVHVAGVRCHPLFDQHSDFVDPTRTTTLAAELMHTLREVES